MDDRELLELAAKAAGMWGQDFALDDDDQPIYEDGKGFYLSWGRGWWCPPNDDGDAFRLAVKLGIDVFTSNEGIEAIRSTSKSGEKRMAHWVSESLDHDPYSATRRAIVRCAADTGSEL